MIAITLVSDDFSYANGALVPNGGWANHSGATGEFQVSSGAAVIQHGGSEDVNLGFATQTSGVITASFDIVVTDDAAIAGTDFEYFAHFFQDGSFNFRSRASIVSPVAAGDYTLGISSGSSSEEAILTNDFNFGDTVAVSISFDFSDGTGSLSVNGETVNGTALGTGERFNRFAMRQSISSSNETITLDNLVITTTVSEPSTAILGSIGLLALFGRRR